MKRTLITIFIAPIFIFSACSNITRSINVAETPLPTVFNETMTKILEEKEQTEEPVLQSTVQVTNEPTAQPTPVPTSEPTPTPKPTEVPTYAPTSKPIVEPTAEPKPTQQPTAQSTPEPTPDNQDEIIPVSSSFINAAMAEINRLREANGIAPATFSSGISSSCKRHAIAMAESGEVFHASGIYMFEAVGRASKHMPGATMGGAAANHVVQLQSDEVTKIGIGAVYYGDYVFYVVRGD